MNKENKQQASFLDIDVYRYSIGIFFFNHRPCRGVN